MNSAQRNQDSHPAEAGWLRRKNFLLTGSSKPSSQLPPRNRDHGHAAVPLPLRICQARLSPCPVSAIPRQGDSQDPRRSQAAQAYRLLPGCHPRPSYFSSCQPHSSIRD